MPFGFLITSNLGNCVLVYLKFCEGTKHKLSLYLLPLNRLARAFFLN